MIFRDVAVVGLKVRNIAVGIRNISAGYRFYSQPRELEQRKWRNISEAVEQDASGNS